MWIVARTWCTIFPKGPSKDVGAVAGEMTGTGTQLPNASSHPPHTNCHHQAWPGWALTRKQELEGEAVLSSGQAPCKDRREMSGTGDLRSPKVTPQGPNTSRCCSPLAHTASDSWISQPVSPALHSSTGPGPGKGWGTSAWLDQQGGRAIPEAKAHPHPREAFQPLSGYAQGLPGGGTHQNVQPW